MLKAIISLILTVSVCFANVSSRPYDLIPSARTLPDKLTNEQQSILNHALPSKATAESQFLEHLLLTMLVVKPIPGLKTPESVAKLLTSYKILFDLSGVSLDSFLQILSKESKIYQKLTFPGLGVTLHNGRVVERTSSIGRTIRGLFYNVDRRYSVDIPYLQFKIIGRDFGNMRDGARTGVLMFANQPDQRGKTIAYFSLNAQQYQLLSEVLQGYSMLPPDMKQKILTNVLKLQMFDQSLREEKARILRDILVDKTGPKNSQIVVAQPTDHLSCPRRMPEVVSQELVPAGGNALVRTLSRENIQGMVIRTPVKGEEIAAIDFSKIPDQAQRDYMKMMADLVRHKIEDPALSRDERQAILDGFRSDVDHMMKTGTFNPVAHRTFASIFAEYTLYNALSLGLGKLPWAMGMLKSTVVETVVPPSSFLNTTITAATCTAALPGIAGQVTQKRLDPYALVKGEGQEKFQVMHPDEVAKHKPSAFMQGAAMACSAAAGMVVMAGCNAALSAAGVEDGTTSAVLAAGVVLVAKSAAEAAMLHTPTQKKIESVVRPAVGVSKSALRWLWDVITEVPDVGDEDVYLF